MVRIKYRYLLINILYPDERSPIKPSGVSQDEIPFSVRFRQPSSDEFSAKLLGRLIREGVADLFGDYGSGKVANSLQIKYFSPATSTAIIRVSRDYYRLVWTALTYITHLPRPIDQPCVIQVVRVSGTIRKAEEEAVRRARISIRRAQKAATRTKLGSATTGSYGVSGENTNDDDDLGMAGGIEDLDDGDDDGSGGDD